MYTKKKSLSIEAEGDGEEERPACKGEQEHSSLQTVHSRKKAFHQ